MASNPRHSRRNRSYRRRRNPGFSGGSWSALLTLTAWSIAGGVATRAIPQAVLGSNNSGISGYGANLVTALGLGWAAGKFFGSNAGTGVTLGGLTMLAGRIISDTLGQNLVSFGGMSGDADFDLGLYIASPFSAPTTSEDGVAQNPWAAVLGPGAASVVGTAPMTIAAGSRGAASAAAPAAMAAAGGNNNGFSPRLRGRF
jgi:hypothetical protein